MSSVVKIYLASLLIVPPILLVLDVQGVLALGLVSGLVYALLYLPLAFFAFTGVRGSSAHP